MSIQLTKEEKASTFIQFLEEQFDAGLDIHMSVCPLFNGDKDLIRILFIPPFYTPTEGWEKQYQLASLELNMFHSRFEDIVYYCDSCKHNQIEIQFELTKCHPLHQQLIKQSDWLSKSKSCLV